MIFHFKRPKIIDTSIYILIDECKQSLSFLSYSLASTYTEIVIKCVIQVLNYRANLPTLHKSSFKKHFHSFLFEFQRWRKQDSVCYTLLSTDWTESKC